MKCDSCKKDKRSVIEIQLYKNGVKVNKENFCYEDDYQPHSILCKECIFDMILTKGTTNKYSYFDEELAKIFGRDSERLFQ